MGEPNYKKGIKRQNDSGEPRIRTRNDQASTLIFGAAGTVFSELGDPLARARWSAPSNDTIVYDEADFRIGGTDVFRCGPKGDPKLETH